MKHQIKQWYEKATKIKTRLDDWTQETVELGQEELDKSLLPNEEWQLIVDTIDVDFYGIQEDVVYALHSNVKKGFILLGLLRNGKLIESDYLVNKDEKMNPEIRKMLLTSLKLILKALEKEGTDER